MADAVMTSYLFAMFYNVGIFVVPPLVVATIVAFIVGLLQAVTQIQEQTLPQTIKIFVIGLMLLMMGPLLAGPLYATADTIFSGFYRSDFGQ